MFHSCNWDGPGKTETTYHDEGLKRRVDSTMTVNLTESVKTIIAENPDTGLLRL